MRRFVVWLALVALIDGTTCLALHALINPSPALTNSVAACVAEVDARLANAATEAQLHAVEQSTCGPSATQSVPTTSTNVEATAQDILYARAQCPNSS